LFPIQVDDGSLTIQINKSTNYLSVHYPFSPVYL
jgi:hypothetical protein